MPVLNCDALPQVETSHGVLATGQLGYADALRSLIPQTVVATTEETGRGLRVEFPDAAVVLHPHIDDVPGADIALLGGFEDGRWMCWRSGEESFEDLA
jgi:hypothetical protein